MKTPTLEQPPATTAEEEQLRILDQIPAGKYREEYAAQFARVLSISSETTQEEGNAMETDTQASGNATLSDPEAIVRRYLTRHKGVIISPTSEHQTAVLDGKPVDANVAKVVSLEGVGRVPLQFAVELES